MRPTEVTHVLYHADCADGFGAAYAAWKVLGDEAVYLPAQHGDPPPELPSDARVAMVDFSYKRPVIMEIKESVADLVVLDHHATARDELEGLSWAEFDMDKSGARLAWEFWHPGAELPELLAYIEDKDLWLWRLPDSAEVTIALHSYPMDFAIWDKLDLDHLKLEGVALLRLQEQIVAAAVQRASFDTLFGHRVPVVNATEFRSEIANRLCSLHPQCPFAAAYHYDKSGELCWSLRSIGEFDVAALARQAGGGGHKNASGFNGPAPQMSSRQR
jgi:oligoribonuclease NrnB/cAMP/cGMP phosphodiesterase (DHH superfamily)